MICDEVDAILSNRHSRRAGWAASVQTSESSDELDAARRLSISYDCTISCNILFNLASHTAARELSQTALPSAGRTLNKPRVVRMERAAFHEQSVIVLISSLEGAAWQEQHLRGSILCLGEYLRSAGEK